MAGTFDNYARALWELHVPENRVSEAAELLKDNPVLWEALKNPVICLKEKERIIDRIFPEEMRGFLKTVCSHGRASSLMEILAAYDKYKKEGRGILKAVITCVTPPEEKQRCQIESFLKKKFGKMAVEFEIRIDPALLGGFILEAEGEEYDRSLRGFYRRLREYLCGGESA